VRERIAVGCCRLGASHFFEARRNLRGGYFVSKKNKRMDDTLVWLKRGRRWVRGGRTVEHHGSGQEEGGGEEVRGGAGPFPINFCEGGFLID